MNRPAKPVRRIAFTSIPMPVSVFVLGLSGFALSSLLGCQVVGGLEDLRLANGGAGGGIGNGGDTNGSSAASSSSSVASSSGAPIEGDISCGSAICPIGAESACCSDYYKFNSAPYLECVKGPPGNDGCNTAGGANGYETRIQCQIPAHCPAGTVCCGNIETISPLTWYTSLSCKTSCTWPDTVVCDPMAPENKCPVVNNNGLMMQTVCTTSGILPTDYVVCK